MDFKKIVRFSVPSLLLLTCVFAAAQVFANTCAPEVDTDETEADTRSTKKCLSVGTLRVCNNATVVGAFCAGSISLCPTPAAGTPGVIGLGGDLAYGYLYNIGTETVTAGSPITFSNVGPVSGETASGTALTVANAGLYRLEFQARAGGAAPIQFALVENGVTAPPLATFVGNDTLTTGTVNVSGVYLGALPAGAAITVVNTGATVVLGTDGASGQENAYLIVERVAA